MKKSNTGEQRLQTTYRLLERLQESHDRYQRLVDALSDIVFEFGDEGLVYLNQAWTEVLGHEVKASLGHHLLEFVLETDRMRFDQWLIDTQDRGKQTVKVDLRMLNRNGHERWVQIAGSYDGVFRKHYGIIRDITDAKLAERVLLESERRFRA